MNNDRINYNHNHDNFHDENSFSSNNSVYIDNLNRYIERDFDNTEEEGANMNNDRIHDNDDNDSYLDDSNLTNNKSVYIDNSNKKNLIFILIHLI